jgi:hypothetical protein
MTGHPEVINPRLYKPGHAHLIDAAFFS